MVAMASSKDAIWLLRSSGWLPWLPEHCYVVAEVFFPGCCYVPIRVFWVLL